MAPVNLSVLMSHVDFSTVVLAVLAVASGIAVVAVAQRGIEILFESIKGDRVSFGGKYWDKDVYDKAMQNLVTYKKNGGSLDRESSLALKEWKNSRARDGLF